ncbi:hypothetical protein JZ751_007237 [Albula glossodonta]|uniref:RFX-type winged-helix domain-containing protein n=1 Tax=Albula glossodonta TaxID=121402 RepID=A0A8T2NAI6_9TELE|nr:hypothetical protein JZ751_007237 [Albula glossodonta]
MAEDGPQAAAPSRDGGGLDPGETGSEPSMLLQKLKSNIPKNIQSKVDFILQEVQRFSDSDKLYLYLQLPSGPGTGEKSGGDSSSFNTSDQLHACNWIRSHLEEHADTCLPKQDVYEAYRRYCDNLQYRPLSAANFGKIIRDIFPNIKARRLGGRGHMPLLPSLDLKNDPSELTELVQTYKQEVTEAACELICDWAQKILKRSFDTVVEIARFLVQEHIVNPRCSQAELVTSAALAGGPPKPHKVIKRSMVPPKGGGAEGEGGGTDNSKDRDRGDQASPGKPAHGEGKPQARGAEGGVRAGGASLGGGASGGRDLQAVEAVMKRYPQLLPRGTLPEKATPPTAITAATVTVAAVTSSSPPTTATLAPRGDAPATPLKVTLPIAMATLPAHQHHHPAAAATVFNMILPSGVSLAYPEREKAPAVTMATPNPTTPTPAPVITVQKPRGAAPKRAPEAPPTGEAGATPPKRKRGRPRKPRPEELGAGQPPPPPPPPPPPTATTSHALAPLTGGVIQKALPAPSTSSSSSSTQPPQTPQPEIMEIVIQDQHIRLLSALPGPASSLEAPPLPGSGGVVTGTDGSQVGQQKSVVVQCFRPGPSGTDIRTPQEGSAANPHPHAQPVLVLQGPPKAGGLGWDMGGATTVEVIRRAPVSRETKAPDTSAPPTTTTATTLSTLIEEKEEEDEEEEVEIILTPVEPLSESTLTAAQGDAP